jgi:hypothetical protein
VHEPHTARLVEIGDLAVEDPPAAGNAGATPGAHDVPGDLRATNLEVIAVRDRSAPGNGGAVGRRRDRRVPAQDGVDDAVSARAASGGVLVVAGAVSPVARDARRRRLPVQASAAPDAGWRDPTAHRWLPQAARCDSGPFVSCAGSEPSAFIAQIWYVPFLLET